MKDARIKSRAFIYVFFMQCFLSTNYVLGTMLSTEDAHKGFRASLQSAPKEETGEGEAVANSEGCSLLSFLHLD